MCCMHFLLYFWFMLMREVDRLCNLPILYLLIH
jgi:hypothetical protein